MECQASHKRRESKVSAANMVQITTAEKNDAAGAATVEVKLPKLTRADMRAITKMSSIDHRPINSIKRNIAALCRRPFFHLNLIVRRMIIIPIILKTGTRTDAINIIRPIPNSPDWKKYIIPSIIVE